MSEQWNTTGRKCPECDAKTEECTVDAEQTIIHEECPDCGWRIEHQEEEPA